MDEDKAYQCGLLDHIDGRPSLAPILSVMGETYLLVEYAKGRIIGEQLLTGEGAIYDESVA